MARKFTPQGVSNSFDRALPPATSTLVGGGGRQMPEKFPLQKEDLDTLDIGGDSEPDIRRVKKCSRELLGEGSGNGRKECSESHGSKPDRAVREIFPVKRHCISDAIGA
jgi:hypothetical protein